MAVLVSASLPGLGVGTIRAGGVSGSDGVECL